MERFLRVPVSMVPGGGDAGGRGEFHRRYPFVAGFGAAGGAVCGNGPDVLSVGHDPC